MSDLRDYEMVVLLHPDLEIDLDKPLKKVSSIISDNGGKVTKQDNWGKRKLAYPIKGQDFAVYVYNEIKLPPTSFSKVENTLNITNEVIRYLITQPVPEVEKKEDKREQKAEEDDEKPEKESAKKDEKVVKTTKKVKKDDKNKEEDKNEE